MRFVPEKPLFKTVLCTCVFAVLGSYAHAVPIVWQLNNFDLLDGGVATGVFTYDADTNTYSDVSITTTAGTISGNPFPGASYSLVRNFGGSPGARLVSLLASSGPDLTGVSNFGMRYDGALTNSGGTLGLNFFTEAICANASCTAVFAGGRGVASGVPNNATITSIEIRTDVGIDIKPFGKPNKPNKIKLRRGGFVKVAILSTNIADGDSVDFDALQVDPTTVEFGPNGANAKSGRVKVRDVDHDGDADLILRFRIRATGISCEDTEASLAGETFAGEPFTGSDSIMPIHCHKAHSSKLVSTTAN